MTWTVSGDQWDEWVVLREWEAVRLVWCYWVPVFGKASDTASQWERCWVRVSAVVKWGQPSTGKSCSSVPFQYFNSKHIERSAQTALWIQIQKFLLQWPTKAQNWSHRRSMESTESTTWRSLQRTVVALVAGLDVDFPRRVCHQLTMSMDLLVSRQTNSQWLRNDSSACALPLHQCSSRADCAPTLVAIALALHHNYLNMQVWWWWSANKQSGVIDQSVFSK